MNLRRTIFWVTLSLFCFTIDGVYAQQTNDIRNVRWGFTPKQVRETESIRPSSHKRDKLIYDQVPLANRKVGLEYDFNFNGDSLMSVSYFYYMRATVTRDDVVAAAVEFEALLTEKYGPGKVSLLGDIRNVVWRTPRTLINLSVGNVDKGWSLEIEYRGRISKSNQGKTGATANEAYRPLKDIKDF